MIVKLKDREGYSFELSDEELILLKHDKNVKIRYTETGLIVYDCFKKELVEIGHRIDEEIKYVEDQNGKLVYSENVEEKI